MKKNKSKMSLSSQLIADEAQRRGIAVTHLNAYYNGPVFLELVYKKHREAVFGQASSASSYESFLVQRDKELTKFFVQRAGIQVARGQVVKRSDADTLLPVCRKIGFPVVLKPRDGSHGTNVFTHIKDATDLRRAKKEIFKDNKSIIAEKMFTGVEYRVLATRNKVLAAAQRMPANVVGDGKQTIQELVAEKNVHPRRGVMAVTGWTTIKINEEVLHNLKKLRLKPSSIIAKNRLLYLRNNSNISTGGDSVDVTDIMHQSIKKIAINTVQSIHGLAYAGVDIMLKDSVKKKPTKNGYIVVEVNASPGLNVHEFPFTGKPRNVPSGIIDILFPETIKVNQ